MERRILRQLEAWKASPRRKPLLLYGARQVGKTWTMLEFGRRAYERTIRYDLSADLAARRLFDHGLDARRIIADIELREGGRIDPANTLIIFDEVQEVPSAITALKYFYEDAREYHVMAAGSYLGITHREGSSFPVGKVNTLTLHPMTFEEFLLALGDDIIVEGLERLELERLGRAVEDILELRLRQYLVVGGMPEVVATFAPACDHALAREVQSEICIAYDSDFGKHAPARLLERMRLVWNSVPSQLARENRKFVYGAVRPGARAKDFDESIQWLRDYGAVNKVSRARALRHPVSAYEDLGAFKLYALDVGLLSCLSALPPQVVLDGSHVFTEFKGALTEQFVLQELLACGLKPLYWSGERSTAEVDFAVSIGERVVPIEVKAAENLKAKSLRVACDKFGIELAVRTSLSGFRDDGWLVNVPLWGIGRLEQVLECKAGCAR